MRRIERLINLIAALLETDRPMTAEQIRSDIAGYEQPNQDAFRRTFERDKESLRAMGIPLELRRTDPLSAEADGYIIPKDKYYLPELDLQPDEVAALSLAAEAILSGADVAESGLRKLSLDAPSIEWNGPRVVWGADVAAEQPVLGPLYAALLERRAVAFDYRVAGGDLGRRRVEPYGLVHRSGHWYLVGRDVDRDGMRSFKVSRIASAVDTTSSEYSIPESFDAGSHLAGEPWEIGEGDDFTAIVRFDRSLRWWPEQNLTHLVSAEGPDGSLDVEVKVSNADAFVSWVLGFGDSVEILEPAEARARLVRHLDPLLEGHT